MDRKRIKALLSQCFALALCISTSACGKPSQSTSSETTPAYRNLFTEYLGADEASIDAKIDASFQSIFYGDDETERLYYPVSGDMAYIWDVANDDVRSEGQSYGMMIAVQMDKKEEFDRIWKWTDTYMRHKSGPLEGYFAWHCRTDGTRISEGPASDGEEWIAMALFFASHRWGDGEGIFNYSQHAQKILRDMIHKESPGDPRVVSIFDTEHHIVRFVPWADWDGVTDASYHLPHFYELWARWADDDQDFWARCAEVSRDFFKQAAHPETGLMPDYSYYKPTDRTFGDHKDFRFDAWRNLAHVALDHDWWQKDPDWQTMQSNRVLRFLDAFHPDIPNQFSVDGTPRSDSSSTGLYAMMAVAALAADRELGERYVQHLWDAPPPTGQWRYYDGVLHMLALLQVSGRFQIHE